MDRSIVDLLDAVDLQDLADRLLVRHNPRMRNWSCPVHEGQTGRTPPVTVFRDRRGVERWHCHACGAGGTAIDLVIAVERCDLRTAISELCDQKSLAARSHNGAFGAPLAVTAPVPGCVAAYVRSCEEVLASGGSGAVGRWLAGRGLEQGVLRANRVGADPGPRDLPRPRGLPAGGVGAVFPVLDREGEAVGLQVRYLRPRRLRYQSPSAAVVPSPPHLAVIRPPVPPSDRQTVVVCEGMIDAMTVSQAGWRACAVLGVGRAGGRVTHELVSRYPGRDLVVGFDSDAAGESGAARLIEGVNRAGGSARRLLVPPEHGDLNAWACAEKDFTERLGEAVTRRPATQGRTVKRAPPAPPR